MQIEHMKYEIQWHINHRRWRLPRIGDSCSCSLPLPATLPQPCMMKYSAQSYSELLQFRTGAIAALNTQTNQTYLHQGAINKSQFQFLSFTASLIAPCNSYYIAFNPIAIGIPHIAIRTAKIRSSDTGAWRAAMGIAEFFRDGVI